MPDRCRNPPRVSSVRELAIQGILRTEGFSKQEVFFSEKLSDSIETYRSSRTENDRRKLRHAAHISPKAQKDEIAQYPRQEIVKGSCQRECRIRCVPNAQDSGEQEACQPDCRWAGRRAAEDRMHAFAQNPFCCQRENDDDRQEPEEKGENGLEWTLEFGQDQVSVRDDGGEDKGQTQDDPSILNSLLVGTNHV